MPLLIAALFAVFIAVPIAEIAVFIMVGEAIGVAATIGLVIATAILGVWLVRRQGLDTLRRAQAEIERNQVPAAAMGEGVALVAAGILLVVPGFITDTIGFLLLIPSLRRHLIGWIGARIAANATIVDIRAGGASSRGAPGGRSGPGRAGGRVIDIEAIEVDADSGNGPDGEDERRGVTPWRPR